MLCYASINFLLSALSIAVGMGVGTHQCKCSSWVAVCHYLCKFTPPTPPPIVHWKLLKTYQVSSFSSLLSLIHVTSLENDKSLAEKKSQYLYYIYLKGCIIFQMNDDREYLWIELLEVLYAFDQVLMGGSLFSGRCIFMHLLTRAFCHDVFMLKTSLRLSWKLLGGGRGVNFLKKKKVVFGCPAVRSAFPFFPLNILIHRQITFFFQLLCWEEKYFRILLIL